MHDVSVTDTVTDFLTQHAQYTTCVGICGINLSDFICPVSARCVSGAPPLLMICSGARQSALTARHASASL
jgi:hypothetical protein